MTTGQGAAPAVATANGAARAVTAPPRTSIFTIRPAASDADIQYVNGLIYGPAGVGKTHLFAESALVPEMRDVLVIDTESGRRTIPQRWGLDAIPVSGFNQISEIQRFLRLHCKYREAGNDEKLQALAAKYFDPDYLPATPRRYQTVIIDTLNELDQYLIYSIQGLDLGDYALDQDMGKMQLQDWGENSDKIRILIRQLRELPINVLITCAGGSIEEGPKDGKRTAYLPQLPGKLARAVLAFTDLVGYYDWATVQVEGEDGKPRSRQVRRLYLRKGKKEGIPFEAKARIRGSYKPTYLDNPTMQGVYDLLCQDEAESDDDETTSAPSDD